MSSKAIVALNHKDDPTSHCAQLLPTYEITFPKPKSYRRLLTAAATMVQSSRPVALTIPIRT